MVGDNARIKVHGHLLSGLDFLGGSFAFQNGQADVDGVAVENPGKALGDDTAGAAGLDAEPIWLLLLIRLSSSRGAM